MEVKVNKDSIRQWANVLSVLLALAINILANTLPLNGQNTGAISDRFQVYFVPAGYVFAIWGVIYLGWIAFAAYQALPARKESPRLRRLGYWFALSGVLNAAWLFCWHYNQFGLSVAVMLALLGTLSVSYLRLEIGLMKPAASERWVVDVPFGIYLGWISVATIANITSWLDWIAWDGFGILPWVWAVIMLFVATAIGVVMAITRRDIAFTLVLAWSFTGIALKQSETPLVPIIAWAATFFTLGLVIFSYWRKGGNTPAGS
jgi:hypothetical protein